jgi:allophanate hydrolase subunit 2
MGYRLEGGALPTTKLASVSSHGVVPGTVQVPPNGAPILLLADAQPTGGYPILAAVIGADLPLAAQLLPGDQLHFRLTTLAEAVAAWRTLTDWQSATLESDVIVEQLAWV